MSGKLKKVVRDTSREAYQQIKPHIGRLHKLVLWYVAHFPDRTYRELACIIGFPETATVSRRGGELERKGLIKSSGIKVQSNNRKAHTWVATKKYWNRDYLTKT